MKNTYVRNGFAASDVLTAGVQYYKHTYNGGSVYPLAKSTNYWNVDGVVGDDAVTTSYAYTWRTDASSVETNRIASTVTSAPAVAATRNGSGTTDTTTTLFDTAGRVTWTRNQDGFIQYSEYDPTGGLKTWIDDVDTSAVTNEPTGWVTPSGGGRQLVTARSFDGLGRVTKLTTPNGVVTYTVYSERIDPTTGDESHETRVYQGWNATTGATTGPTMVT